MTMDKGLVEQLELAVPAGLSSKPFLPPTFGPRVVLPAVSNAMQRNGSRPRVHPKGMGLGSRGSLSKRRTEAFPEADKARRISSS